MESKDRSWATYRINGKGTPLRLDCGATIGRSEAARVRLLDPGLSAVHARVTRRQGKLYLMGLARPFEHEGRMVMNVPLKPGVTLRLTSAIELHVEEVHMDPDGVDEAPTESLGLDVPVRVSRDGQGLVVETTFGQTVTLFGVEAELTEQILALSDHRHWSVPAARVWADTRDEKKLRERFDATLKRIRTRLKTSGVPDQLFDMPKGHGTIRGLVSIDADVGAPLRTTDGPA